jgi:hypothetical protein
MPIITNLTEYAMLQLPMYFDNSKGNQIEPLQEIWQKFESTSHGDTSHRLDDLEAPKQMRVRR